MPWLTDLVCVRAFPLNLHYGPGDPPLRGLSPQAAADLNDVVIPYHQIGGLPKVDTQSSIRSRHVPPTE